MLIACWIGVAVMVFLLLPIRLHVRVDVDPSARKIGLVLGLWRERGVTLWLDWDKGYLRTAWSVKPLSVKLDPSLPSSRPAKLLRGVIRRGGLNVDILAVGGDPFVAAMWMGALQALLPMVNAVVYAGERAKGNVRVAITVNLWDVLHGAYIGESMEDLLQNAMTALRGMVDGDTIVGRTLATPDGSWVVPISKLSVGVVTGSGQYGQSKTPSPYQAGGGGAGGSVTPVGFLVMTRMGVRFMSVDDKEQTNKWLDLVDAASRILHKE